jgi:hypothetical protein
MGAHLILILIQIVGSLWMTMLFDGVRVHPTANYTYGRHQFGVIFERGRHPGASYSVSF